MAAPSFCRFQLLKTNLYSIADDGTSNRWQGNAVKQSLRAVRRFLPIVTDISNTNAAPTRDEIGVKIQKLNGIDSKLE
jgi:hypothetical protein